MPVACIIIDYTIETTHICRRSPHVHGKVDKMKISADQTELKGWFRKAPVLNNNMRPYLFTKVKQKLKSYKFSNKKVFAPIIGCNIPN